MNKLKHVFLKICCSSLNYITGAHTNMVLNALMLVFFVFRESWKRNQAVKHVFSWMLVQVERPCLTEYLEKVFPPSLLISDDYHTENKVLGVHCLHHIVLNVVSRSYTYVHHNYLQKTCPCWIFSCKKKVPESKPAYRAAKYSIIKTLLIWMHRLIPECIEVPRNELETQAISVINIIFKSWSLWSFNRPFVLKDCCVWIWVAFIVLLTFISKTSNPERHYKPVFF